MTLETDAPDEVQRNILGQRVTSEHTVTRSCERGARIKIPFQHAVGLPLLTAIVVSLVNRTNTASRMTAAPGVISTPSVRNKLNQQTPMPYARKHA